MISILLSPLAFFYNGITTLRNWLYDTHFLTQHSLNSPVISVGNITAGGTGKTPFSISLANQLVKKGYQPAIITRGYKRKSNGQIIVSNGSGPLVAPSVSGDEAYLMAEKTNDVVIIADKDRYAAGEVAVTQYHCNVIIADDCFQHRRLKRDIDIVLWDSYQSPYREKVLPVGRLRESYRGLARASFVVLTRTAKIKEAFRNFFHQYQLNTFLSPTIITAITYQDNFIDISLINNEPVFAFCGLGNHDQFFDTLKTLQPSQLITAKFPDHHTYSELEIVKILEKAKKTNCRYILTTEKDRTNIPEQFHKQFYFVAIKLAINQELLDEIVTRLSENH